MNPTVGEAGRVEVAWGPERAETALLDAISGEVAALYGEPGNLALPLRVVVPSRSLRLHLGARVVGRLLMRPQRLNQGYTRDKTPHSPFSGETQACLPLDDPGFFPKTVSEVSARRAFCLLQS